MEIKWQEALLKYGEEILRKGGVMEFKVIIRSNERMPFIYCYPESKIECKKEYIVD